MVNIYIYFLAVTFPESPWDSQTPLARVGARPASSGVPGGRPPDPVLTNTFPSSNPPKLDQLASFLLGPKVGGLATLQPHSSSLSLWLLSALSSALNLFLGWGSETLPSGLPSPRPLARAAGTSFIGRGLGRWPPAPAGLPSPHTEAVYPWRRLLSQLPLLRSLCCGYGVGVRGQDCDHGLGLEEPEFADFNKYLLSFLGGLWLCQGP